MSVLEQGEDLEQRLEHLERGLAETIRNVSANEARLDVLEGVRGRTRATTPGPSPATASPPEERVSPASTTLRVKRETPSPAARLVDRQTATPRLDPRATRRPAPDPTHSPTSSAGAL